ncbi:peptidylprolyl isomerase [Roseospira goensis]|uniref:Parvulin-like PPIase n=1 Tax=Roseospira goensis TaxID=391922 RepID=A0A7W6S1F7_9PROT|nr:peptidylprolyl isomerase [Roseospira goensis]MBB4286437.1 peptidyl-prolyl cis-trans isomerase D [Roseospira goensis]
MLDTFRKATKSWLAKGLLILLIISFGAWGIGDFITGGGGEAPAITVGDTEIGTAALRAELNREVNALREQLGGGFTTEQAIELGFLDRAIGRMVTEVTQVQTARDWGMVVPDSVVAQAITADPTFAGEGGGFDRARFERLLALNNLTEAQYTQQIRQEMLRGALTAPVTEAAHAPDGVVSRLDRHRNEARVGAVVALSVADAPAPTGAPDQETLQDLYDANIDRFTAPEYRAVTAIVLDLEDARPLVSVSDEAIRDEYESQRGAYTQAERRVVDQVLADDRATAQAVVDAVRAGTPLPAAAAEAGAPAPIDMGEVIPDSLPPAQSDAVFAVPEGGVSAPVESPFGWHVFQVREVLAGGTQPLAAVRDEIRATLVDRRAVDALYDLSVRLDDTLGGGATLEDAAQALDLDLVSIDAVDRQGLGPDGTPVEAVPEGSAFLGTAFSADPGEQTLLQETETGYFVLRVDGVTPPAPRPLAQVRDRVMALWERQRKAEATRARAEAILAAAGEGRTLQGAAETQGATAETLPAVRRDGTPLAADAEAPPRALVQALFDLDRGAARLVETGETVYVLRLTEVIGAGADATETRAETAAALRGAIADDLYVQFTDALSRRQGVEINQAVIQAAFQ